jgi:hypothetical protein
MNKFVKNNSGIKFTFYRGPIKYKYKGLIHFLVYTWDEKSDFKNRKQFISEARPVLKSLIKNSKLISGKSLNSLTEDIDFSDREVNDREIENIKSKYNLLCSKNKVSYREWIKTKRGWKFLRKSRPASKFLKDYLRGYYLKNIENKKMIKSNKLNSMK